MPHYPDEIEYSDKYMDDHYEYRHVILPKDVYRRLPRGRLLTESVHLYPFRNGAQWESNSPADGHTTSYTVQNLTSCCSDGPSALTRPPTPKDPSLQAHPSRASSRNGPQNGIITLPEAHEVHMGPRIIV